MASGPVGVWKVGSEQVGGFLDWSIIVDTQSEPKKTNIAAASFWLFKEVPGATALFYTDGADLILAQEFDVLFDLPDCGLDRIVHKPIRMQQL